MLNNAAKSTSVKKIIICLLLLNGLSLLSLYSSLHLGGEFSNYSIFLKQVIWITISWLFLIIFSFINYRFYFDLSFIIYAFNIILLFAVHFFGKEAMGAQRWLSFMGFTFQPSELSKIAIIFILARFFSIRDRKDFLKGVLLPLSFTVFVAMVIIKQPDLGTGLFLILLFFMMGFASSIRKKHFIILILCGMLMAPIGFKFLKPYQKQRLMVFLNPNEDPLGAGYTIIQSKIAIGSGKFFGKGFLSGTQNQFNFLPERHTDFIFTVIAEEWGFLGVLLLLVIYGIIIQSILKSLENFKDDFAKILSVGITAFFFLHIFINIGMTLGILPVVGLPLVFLSYGGTNMLVNFILVGIYINISKNNEF